MWVGQCVRCQFVHRLPLIIIFLCDYTPGDRRPVLIIHSTMGLPHRLKVGGLGGYSSTGEKTVMKGTLTLVLVSDPLGSTKSERMLAKRVSLDIFSALQIQWGRMGRAEHAQSGC